MTDAMSIPARSEVSKGDAWDLSSLFVDEAAWEAALAELEALMPGIAALRGSLGSSREAFARALDYYRDFGLLDERLSYYASLRESEDEGDSASRGRSSRYMAASARAQGLWAWLVPEIQALPEAFVELCLGDGRFGEYAVFLRKLLRWKPHVLGEAEERLLALQAETTGIPRDVFSVLTNVDLDFGTIDTPEGPRPLSQSSFASFLRNPDRGLRARAYSKFYSAYEAHKQSLAALYSGSVKQDKYRALVRGFPSARAAALFPDDVDASVYDNLVASVSDSLPALHEYYELRRRALGLDELRHYDLHVPLAPETKSKHGYAEAAELVCAALAPLGDEYVATLRAGLEGGWVDRYENKGKHSGAFSAGSFAGDPYILLNYKEDVLHDVFTIAHEGGHSMHSRYSAASNPFLSYGYAIFEAEVASTFNEQLLFRHLYDRAASDAERAYLASVKLDDVVATLFRQTMFAEFEGRTHEMAEADEPLTVESLRSEYRKLLAKYLGPKMRLEEASDLECLRIPHFYNAFYVYKYATGISASIALSERVLSGAARGSSREREDYFGFLRSGGSRFPIESLKVAGVDMSSPEPVRAACASLERWTAELKRLLKL
jgi:oligoendopeptidase F